MIKLDAHQFTELMTTLGYYDDPTCTVKDCFKKVNILGVSEMYGHPEYEYAITFTEYKHELIFRLTYGHIL